MAVISPCFHSLGTFPSLSDNSNINSNGCEILVAIFFNIWDAAHLVQVLWIFLVQVASFLLLFRDVYVGEPFFEVSLGHLVYLPSVPFCENTAEEIGKNLGFFVVLCCILLIPLIVFIHQVWYFLSDACCFVYVLPESFGICFSVFDYVSFYCLFGLFGHVFHLVT